MGKCWAGLLVVCVLGVGCGPADPADQAQIDEENAASTQQGLAEQQLLNLQAQVQRTNGAVAAVSNIMKKRASTSATISSNLK